MSRLENWVIITYEGIQCLYGEVYGDNRFVDGHHVVTSEIKSIDEDKNKAITRSGTEYTLGQKYNNIKNLN